MKINNIILVLRTRIILLSSFVIYFFCICHSGRFPIIQAGRVGWINIWDSLFFNVCCPDMRINFWSEKDKIVMWKQICNSLCTSMTIRKGLTGQPQS